MPLVITRSQNANVFVSDTEPSGPTNGDVWSDTANDVLKVYDGSEFVSVGGSMLRIAHDELGSAGSTHTINIPAAHTSKEYFMLIVRHSYSTSCLSHLTLNNNSTGIYDWSRVDSGTGASGASDSKVNLSDSSGNPRTFIIWLFKNTSAGSDEWEGVWLGHRGSTQAYNGSFQAGLTGALSTVEVKASTGNVAANSYADVYVLEQPT